MESMKILLIEDQERYARMVLGQLRSWKGTAFQVSLHYQYETAPSLLNGKGGGYDVVLFGFQGEEDLPTARKVLKHAEGKAIVMFLLKNNNKRTVEAVRKLGTSRFLIKRDVQSRILPRVLEYEMEMARLRSQQDDGMVFDTQLKKVSQMVDALLKDVRNPSGVARLALVSLSEASKDNGDVSRCAGPIGSDMAQIKRMVDKLSENRDDHQSMVREVRRAKPVHLGVV